MLMEPTDMPFGERQCTGAGSLWPLVDVLATHRRRRAGRVGRDRGEAIEPMPSTYQAAETQRAQRISLEAEISVPSVPLWLRDRFRNVVLAALALILAAAPCAAEWRRIDSPNFTVVGDVGAGELRDMALKFEGFREALSRAISERATAAAVPTIIIVFPNERAFAPFKPTYQGKRRTNVAGFFSPGANLNYILVQSGGVATDRIIFHEYAHLIVSNVMSNPPAVAERGAGGVLQHVQADGQRQAGADRSGNRRPPAAAEGAPAACPWRIC